MKVRAAIRGPKCRERLGLLGSFSRYASARKAQIIFEARAVNPRS